MELDEASAGRGAWLRIKLHNRQGDDGLPVELTAWLLRKGYWCVKLRGNIAEKISEFAHLGLRMKRARRDGRE